MGISLRKLTKYFIFLYILVMMLSPSTGTWAVRIVRIITVCVLCISLYFEFSLQWVSFKFYCIWTTVFLLYNVIMCGFAFSKDYAVDYTLTLMYVSVVDVLLFQYLYRHHELIRPIMRVIILGSLLLGMMVFTHDGLLSFLSARSTDLVSANTLGLYSTIAALFSVYFYRVSQKGSGKIIYAFFLLIMIAYMILSASRKAFVFFGVPVIFYSLMTADSPWKLFVKLLLIAAGAGLTIIAVLKIPLFYQLIGQRLETMFNGLLGVGKTDASTATRLSLIEFGMKYFKAKPWFGYGMSNFKALVEKYRSWGSVFYAHNNYVELLVDCGIVGTGLYYSLYVKMLISGLKKLKRRQPVQILFLGILISFVIAEYGMVTYNLAIYQLILLLCYLILTKDTVQESVVLT